jgi:hypothetical protein
MSKKLKYVIIEDGPILFGEGIPHQTFKPLHPISAGFCYIHHENHYFTVDCFGESVGLKLKSAESDKRQIEKLLNEY